MSDGERSTSVDEALGWMAAQLDAVDRIQEAIRKDLPNLAAIAKTISDALREGGRVFFFGNGGSAADAQHWAAELSGRFYVDRRPLPAIALTTNSSQLTAIGNDYGFDEVFSRPLRGLGAPGDVAVAISTSGSSTNVLRALQVAQDVGLTTVGFTRASDNPLLEMCQFAVTIPSDDVARIQEGHELCAHLIWALVERDLFGPDQPNTREQN